MRSIFLAVTITTAYAHLRGWPAELHPVLRACFAVLVLVLGIGLWRKRERPACSQARAVRAPRWPDYLAISFGVLGVECLFLFFLSEAPPQAETLAIKVEESFRPERAAARISATRADGQGTHGTIVSGNWLWDDQGRRRLPLSSNAIPSLKPEIYFRPTNDGTAARLTRHRPYLRAFALEKFADSTWSPVGISAETLTPDENGWVDIPQPARRPGPVLTGEIIQPAHPDGEDVFTAPQGAQRARVETLRRIDPGIFRLNPPLDSEDNYTYEVASRTVTYTSLIESGVLERFILPKDPIPHLVEVPEEEELRAEVFRISGQTLGPIELRLLNIRQYLWENYEYDLEIENKDQLDPVLNFLVHEKRGHCEFFATAGALLCRALDIPARVAYGWSGGRWYAGPKFYMFRASEAHAWTEIYLEDVGWVVFDTTPPGARTRFDNSQPEDPVPVDEDGEPVFDSIGKSPFNTRLWTYLALVAGLALLPLAFLILRFRRRPTGRPGAISEGLLPGPPGYLARFQQACAQRGSPMPDGRTLRQQLATLAHEDSAPAFGDDLLDYHYAVTYGGAKPNKFRESALLRAIKRWR